MPKRCCSPATAIGSREVDDTAAEEAAAALSALDAEVGRTTDPVRMYMREMGTVELLTREGEIAIAKRIEEGLNQMLSSLASFPWSIKLLLEEYDLHKAGKKRLAEIVAGFNDCRRARARTAGRGSRRQPTSKPKKRTTPPPRPRKPVPTGPDPVEVARRMEALGALLRQVPEDLRQERRRATRP